MTARHPPRRDPALTALHLAWLASLAPAARRFRLALRQPERAQARLLARRLTANAATAYGRAHAFDRIDSPAAFQRRVPITDHDALAPWLDRVMAGEPNVLTAEPVRLFERSGGSTRTTTKLVPYTAALLADFAAATSPWLFDLYRRHRALIGTRAYWSLSPVAQAERRTAGGIPIGMADDTEYFGRARRYVLGKTMAVSPTVARITDFAAWRLETLAQLVDADDLGFISVWSPTFLTVLLDALVADPEPVLARLPRARARRAAAARDALAGGPGACARLWPRLSVVSCWADGPAADQLAAVRRHLPGVVIAPKGLLATEGVVTIPYGPDGPCGSEGPAGGALALLSHALEFIDLERPKERPRWPHELRPGARYSPLLTTGGGLYRYHLKDIVECTARTRLRFIGKLDAVADVAGEKVHAHQVELALAAARARGVSWEFALLAPTHVAGEAPSYCLFLETDAADAGVAAVARDLEAHLLTGHAYRYCRDVGQLGPLRFQRVTRGRARYLEALVASGRRLGDIKPAVLDARPIWGEIFGVGAVPPSATPREQQA